MILLPLATGQYHIYCPGSNFDLVCHRWDTKTNCTSRMPINKILSLIIIRNRQVPNNALLLFVVV